MAASEIQGHIRKHLGMIERCFREIIPSKTPVTIHLVAASHQYPFVRLITEGMSKVPMDVPDEFDEPSCIELIISLPADWKFAGMSMQQNWPVALLRSLASIPRRNRTWLGVGHTIAAQTPYHQTAPFAGALVTLPLSTPQSFSVLPSATGKPIHFLAVIPLHANEMALKIKHGSAEIVKLLASSGAADVVDLKRARLVADSELSNWINCASHGKVQAAKVCCHLVHQATDAAPMVFYVADTLSEDSEEPAETCIWCAACDEALKAAGGWTDESTAFADPRKICLSCLDKITRRNIRGQD